MEKTFLISRQHLIHSTRSVHVHQLIPLRGMSVRVLRLIRNIMQQEYQLWS